MYTEYPNTLSQPQHDDVLRQHVHDLSNVAREDPEAARELRGYDNAHIDYLTGLASSIDERLSHRGSEAVEQPFATGSSSTFATTDGRVESPVDLAALGLPELKEEGQTPFGVVVHNNSHNSRTRTTAITLFTRDNRYGTVGSRYLENITAAVEGDTAAEPRWVYPGNVELSQASVDTSTTTVKDKAYDEKHTLVTVRATPHWASGSDSGEARLIRARPNVAERAAMESSPGFVRRNLKKLGAVAMAGITLALAPIHAKTPDTAQRLDTAQEFVLPAGTANQYDVHQAEQYFDETTLSRSRQAFDAYTRGDKAALKAQASQEGYEDHWIPQADFAAVEQAKNYDELRIAFHNALGDLPVSVDFGVDGIHGDSYTYTPNKDLDHAKKMTTSILKFYNLLDKSDTVKNLRPLSYFIVGSVKSKVHDGVTDPAGYFMHDPNSGFSEVVLASDNGDQDHTAAHETTHDFDLVGFGFSANQLNSIINTLNPIDQAYVGYNSYSSSPTRVSGNQVTAESYGNATAVEDTAVTGQNLQIDNPVLITEDSTLFEKQSAFLFMMEEYNPGFTAAFLERAKLEDPSVVDKTWDVTMMHAVNEGLPIEGSLAGLLLVAVAYSTAMKYRERAALKRYGVVLPSGAVPVYSPSTR